MIGTINAEKFGAYLAVQESGYYNMLDPRARALANEMNDLSITKSEWVDMIKNYESYKAMTYERF
jgi:hypothetical protein